MENKDKDYPLGMQDFAQIVQGCYVYVDKTDFVYRLVSSKKFYFLSRPRRFGKTLLLSTLEYYFQGRQDLFQGLKIDTLEKDWKSYPVLRFDLSTIEASSPNLLKRDLDYLLTEYEKQYGIEPIEVAKKPSLGQRLSKLIKQVNANTGKEVVILIDEYDKGILDVLREDKKLEKNRKVLRNFFTALKANDKHIRFAMLTGVSRFRHLTIFSGLNNLVDISMDRAFASMCGITLGELEEYFQEGLATLGESLGHDRTDLLDILKQKYDGYRFSSAQQHVFNPHSLLSAFVRNELRDYWIMSGTSKVFVDFLSEANFKIENLVNEWYDENTLTSAFDSKQPVPLLYQTGYLTIQEEQNGLFKLSVPNGEVRQSLIEQLMPLYMGISANIPMRLNIIKGMILSGDIDGWLKELKSMIGSAPYQLLVKDEENPVERFYHLMIYQMFIMLGIDTKSEICVAGGRIDMVAQTPKLIYVIEFKIDSTPQSALRQIESKGYLIHYATDGRTLYKIGVSFSSATHNIDRWKYKSVKE
ncbi:MAG: ATP-binding protein [Bacteroidales bacterium]|nr:ATP-binding protein [Bacteroidales bacterium]